MKKEVLPSLSPLYTDMYQLTMAEGYFLCGKHRAPAVFDLYFRTNPFKGGYLVCTGMQEAAEILSGFHFSRSDLVYLKKNGFSPKFLEFLKSFRFHLNIDAVKDGEIVFPHEPLLRIEGTLLECQLAETLLINLIHFPSLVATKASRMVRAAKGRSVIDFGLRRAQGTAGILASRAAYVGGLEGTSNALAGKHFEIPVFGTQAHSWIQAFRDEELAFLAFARIHQGETVLLIDTYDTLKSGLPNALKAMSKLGREGIRVRGLRIDSGDLAYLSKKVRESLDASGYPEVKIFASGQLDEYIIESLLLQGARIDSFGAGTKLVTSYDEPALDMVCKLSSVDGYPEIKISDSLIKMNEPGKKRIYRYIDQSGTFLLDALALADEKKITEVIHPVFELSRTNVKAMRFEEILFSLMRKGKAVREKQNAASAKKYAGERLKLLPEEHQRFYYPHIYRVGVSRKLFQLKEKLIQKRLGINGRERGVL